MSMTKQTVTKEDGRLLTYYWFARKPKAQSRKVESQRSRSLRSDVFVPIHERMPHCPSYAGIRFCSNGS